MTDQAPENVPKPPPFVQPQLVKCTIDECGTLVSVFAKACPVCANPDPARYHESRDPQKRTLARWQYDHSPAVVAWNKAQQQLAEEKARRALQEREEYRRKQEDLGEQYHMGVSISGIGFIGVLLSAGGALLGFGAKDQGSVLLLMLFVASGVAMYRGRKIYKSAEEKGYYPPTGPGSNPG